MSPLSTLFLTVVVTSLTHVNAAGTVESGWLRRASVTNCSDANNGMFGGRPFLGACGIITEMLFGNDNGLLNVTDTDGNASNSSDRGPFGFGPNASGHEHFGFPPNSSDRGPFDPASNASGHEHFGFPPNSSDHGPFGPTSNVSGRADGFGFPPNPSGRGPFGGPTSNQTCVNDDEAPECLDRAGNEGFWVCRTITDPFTEEPVSESVCIGAGWFLDDNDECGCCPSTDGTSDEPTCPDPCPCACDLEGTGDGVWVTTDWIMVDMENATDANHQICIDSRVAISVANGFGPMSCVEECPTEE